MYDDKNIEYCYGQSMSLKNLEKFCQEGKIIICCSLNKDKFNQIFEKYNYKVTKEGYELTGHNDFYQYMLEKQV